MIKNVGFLKGLKRLVLAFVMSGFNGARAEDPFMIAEPTDEEDAAMYGVDSDRLRPRLFEPVKGTNLNG